MKPETLYNLEGFAVVITLVRSNGESVREELLVETTIEDVAIRLALESVRAAYPESREVEYRDHVKLDGRSNRVTGQGVVYGVWFVT